MRACLVTLAAAVVLLFAVGDARGGVQYGITDLGPASGDYGEWGGDYDLSINDKGQVVGTVLTTGSADHAFLYSGSGSMQDLGTLGGGSDSVAHGINDRGQVVGYAYNIGITADHAFLYSGSGPMQDLGTLGGTNSYASGINDRGQVVGNAYTSGNTANHAFLYSGSGPMQDLGTLGGTGSLATGINNSGQVVGNAATSGNTANHAFLYSGSGPMQDLGTLGGTNSYASGINDRGQVVGNAYTSGNTANHAFLYSGSGPMQDLGTLGGTNSLATGINNSGQVVGNAATSGIPAGHAFLYSGNGPMQDLNGLIPDASGWTIFDAEGVNGKGQIVGKASNSAKQTHAVLLSPVFSQFNQGDDRWKAVQLDGTTATIANKGCALTSLAMALTNVGIGTDPGSLNSLLMSNGGFDSDGNIVWGTALKTVASKSGTPLKLVGGGSSDPSYLDSLLSTGNPVIVGVKPYLNPQGQKEWGHFVVVTGKSGSSYNIYDPGWPNSRKTLDYYGNVFETRGYVVDPPDVSEIDISVVAPGSGVNLLLMDSHGNKTGIDGSGVRSELIPNSVHFIDAIVGLDSDQPPTDVSQYISVQNPELSDYGIEVRGIDAGLTSYDLLETAFAPDGSQLWQHEITGVVAAGSVDQYSLTYAVPEPSTVVQLGMGAISLLAYAWRRRRTSKGVGSRFSERGKIKGREK